MAGFESLALRWILALSCVVVFLWSGQSPERLGSVRGSFPEKAESRLILRRFVFSGFLDPQRIPVSKESTEPDERRLAVDFSFLFRGYEFIRKEFRLGLDAVGLGQNKVVLGSILHFEYAQIGDNEGAPANLQLKLLGDDLSGSFPVVSQREHTMRSLLLTVRDGCKRKQIRLINSGLFVSRWQQDVRSIFGGELPSGCSDSSFCCDGLALDYFQGADCYEDSDDSRDEQSDVRQVFGRKQTLEITIRMIMGPPLILIGCLLIYRCEGRRWWSLYNILGFFALCIGFGAFSLPVYWQYHRDNNGKNHDPHNCNTVPQKYSLTSPNYRDTLIAVGDTPMANVLPMEKKVAVISALAEGAGIRQTERMTGLNRETIMHLGVRVGRGCAAILDQKMRGLSCRHLQFR